MYKYVSCPRALHYIKPPPVDVSLSPADVPEAELEIREVFVEWVEHGLGAVVDKPISVITERERVRFDNLNHVLCTLFKNPDYYCAAMRVVNQWKDNTVAKTYARYLLILSKKNTFQL
ncbi:hypothetical protein ACPV5W_03300 [Vibrio astriarenae]